MKVQIRQGKDIRLDQEMCQQVERRLRFSLDRFEGRVSRAKLTLWDSNGSRGGQDKGCRIEVRMLPKGAVFIEERAADLFSAIDQACDRAGRTVARTIGKMRDTERDGPDAPEPAQTEEFERFLAS